jgi:hypothetical protein
MTDVVTMMLDGTEVRVIRDAQHGDKGFNRAKGDQVIIENPAGSQVWQTIPRERLEPVPDLDAEEPVVEPHGELMSLDLNDAGPQSEEDLNQYTVAQLKAALDDAEVEYPSTATKAALIKLAEDNNVQVGSN